MNKSFSFCLFFILSMGFSHSQNNHWRVELSLNDRLRLPFLLEQKSDGALYSIRNGAEQIQLITTPKDNDSIRMDFLEMDSYLMICMDTLKNFRGYWKNNIKNQLIPLQGTFNDSLRFPSTNNLKPQQVSKKYKVLFSVNEDPWPAVGLFEQNGESVNGTFLTETGDFRFLSGNVYGNELFLSCFDGSHAFVFTAKINGINLLGRFYSGSSYQTDWEGVADENVELKSPSELTYIVDSSYDLDQISLRTLCGRKTIIGSLKSPITLIQIMGSWCPNCLDETNYYKSLYQKYKESGLEIKSIGFEYGSTRRVQRKKLKRFVKRAKIPYPVYLGGKASKKLASALFPMLNEISSFPTTLFVNNRGEIIYVHTGFNGPGTGMYFEEYKKETEDIIENLLN